ncbi:hypothetical protein B0H16DRAFT_788040 [Mycena metata]|uniref:Secreted protein n=1 Tax=Mycena metata TaxID=1033252 RepID=A0AAD7NBD5_9AGAR|nr:hypothetical protein B0H16DRAFT_788040 [Mycena metata]
MLFSNALLISVSLAGLMFPTALGVPSGHNIDARGAALTSPQMSMVSHAAQFVVAAKKLDTSTKTLVKGNTTTHLYQSVHVLLKHCSPAGGSLQGSGSGLSDPSNGVMGTCVSGSTAGLNGLLGGLLGSYTLGGPVGGCLLNSGLLSLGGLQGLLGGLLGGLLNVNPTVFYTNAVINDLLALLNAGGCSHDQANDLVADTNGLLNALIALLNLGDACNSCADSGVVGAMNAPGPLAGLSSLGLGGL